jgi:hypothetical protein
VAALGVSDQAEFAAAAIRTGELDADDPAVLVVVRAGVTDRLAVANPRHLTEPDSRTLVRRCRTGLNSA